MCGKLVSPTTLLLLVGAANAPGQDLSAFRSDQIGRLAHYVADAIQPSGLVRDSLVLDPTRPSFHPATPDAAGFALVALAALDRVDAIADADVQALKVLNAYAGRTAGVAPARSADGHFLHFIDPVTGADTPGWDDSYSPIGSALLAAGALFAANHFDAAGSPVAGDIRSVSESLTASIDFDAAIHPSLDGRVYLDMTPQGGGAGGAVRPWNEYQLVVSLALRQRGDNDRAVAVRRQWLNPDAAPIKYLGRTPTLTDNPDAFAPAFWVQQANYFNGDFRHSDGFQAYLANQATVDRAYSRSVLGEPYRYGLTAGVSPQGYHADRIADHPNNVFSPEAVAAWGDLATLLDFAADQPPDSDPRYRYGLVRVSADQPGWVPGDAGLVDHLFLLFGLVESIDPSFFSSRVFAPLDAADYNFDGVVDAADYTVWRDVRGGLLDNLAPDGDLSGVVDGQDYSVWSTRYALANHALANHALASNALAKQNAGAGGPVPEPSAPTLAACAAACWLLLFRSCRAARGQPGSAG
ncbi:hypothetical protein [Botrimarina sp.]|uniref:hypothetical protein n=1 Tax=Botrimarina sp. TaxID=2795802 RepID=UPI0032EB83A9